MATRRDDEFDGISDSDLDGNAPETELSMSLTGLTSEDLEQPQEVNQLQELKESLPQENKLRMFLDNFCGFTTHIRNKLSPLACKLDLATDTHLVGLENILAIMLRTYMRHPEDTELNRANAEQTIGQIQKSLKALQETHPKTFRELLDIINMSPAMKGRDGSKTKKLLKQLFIGQNPKTALKSLMEFTGVQEDYLLTAGRLHTDTNTPPYEECVKDDQHRISTRSYALLAAVLGGMGIAAIGVGVAVACTGIGGPVGCGACIAGATSLLLAGIVTIGASTTTAGVMCGRAMKQTKKEDVTTEEHEDGELEGAGFTEGRDIPRAHEAPLIRSGDDQQYKASADSFRSFGTSTPCRSYNQLNLPVVHSE